MKDNPSSGGHTESRRLAAIMFTDIVGFSRQMGVDEPRMLRLLDVHNDIIRRTVAEQHGTVVKTIGDAFLVDFPSVVHAVQCAQQIQRQFHTHNSEHENTGQLHVRIGIHLGDIVQKDGDVFGDGVNIAKRLQELTRPDTICISDVVYRDVAKKLDMGTVVSLGRPQLKNIAERFSVYALLSAPPQGIRQQFQVQRLKLSNRLRPAPRLALVGVLLVAGTLAAVHYFPVLSPSSQPPTPSPPALPLPDKPSIVVPPFANMSEDPKQDYFSDGITDVLTSDLSRISSLFVIARNTAFTYKGKAINVQEIGKELGVRYVLEGSVQKANDQVRIVVQLIDTTTGEHLWSERFDRPFTDIFALQDEIVKKLVMALKLTLEGYLVRKHTDNLEAYDAFLRGMEAYWHLTKETNVQARQLYEKAVALDPQYAEAYAYLGWTYCFERAWRWSADLQSWDQSVALAHQALALDTSLPLTHSLLGFLHAETQQYDQAIAEGEQAAALDPNNADSYVWQADVLWRAGRPAEAPRLVEQAMRLNPRYPSWYLLELGCAYYYPGRYTEAVAALKALSSRSPNFPSVHRMLALSYVQQWASQQSPEAQPLAQAEAAVHRDLALNDAYARGHVTLGTVYLYQQQYELAVAELARAIALDATLVDGYAFLAEVLSRVGRPEEAVGRAEQALRLKSNVVDYHLINIGAAYDLAGRPDKAITPLRQYLSHYPNILSAHLNLAAAYSELGKEAEAQAEVAEVLRINPKFSLEVHKERVPIKDPEMLERHIAALRKAGLK